MVNHSLDESVSPDNQSSSCFPDFELEGCWSRKWNQNSRNETTAIPKRNDKCIPGWPTSTKARNSLKAKKQAAKELRHAGNIKADIDPVTSEIDQSELLIVCQDDQVGQWASLPFMAWSIPLQGVEYFDALCNTVHYPTNTNKLCPPVHNILAPC